MFIKGGAYVGHSTSSRKNKRDKGRLFDFSNSLIVVSNLFIFIYLISILQRRFEIGRNIRVEHVKIKIRTLEPATPDTISCDV